MIGKAKITLFSLSLLTILIVSMVTGCGSEETITEANESTLTTSTSSSTSTSTSTSTSVSVSTVSSPDNLKQILADSMLAFNSLSPYKFEATMNMQMNIIGSPEAMDTGADITMSGVSNMADKEMQANMTMSMDSSSPDFPDEMQNVEIEMYMLTDLIYMKMNIAGMFDQWIKMPVSEEVMAQYDFNMVNQQLQFLEAPADISLLKEETFDGSECYVLQVIPDMQKLIQWMNEEQFAGELDLSPVEQISDAFKELSLLSWIDKDSKQIRKMDLNMTMEIMPGQLDTEDADFDKMTMDIYMQMTISGYNEPVSIVLPDEAQNAMEISPEMISQ